MSVRSIKVKTKVKVFFGNPVQVEKDLNEFFEKEVRVLHVLQSESSASGGFGDHYGITISVFYTD